MLVGSCKWRREVDRNVLGDLLEHQNALGPTARDAKLLVFAREGFTDRMRARAKDEGVKLLTAADLFHNLPLTTRS